MNETWIKINAESIRVGNIITFLKEVDGTPIIPRKFLVIEKGIRKFRNQDYWFLIYDLTSEKIFGNFLSGNGKKIGHYLRCNGYAYILESKNVENDF